jgi:hypothetical protein
MGNIDFDAARKERIQRRDPLTFTVAGQTFTSLPVVPFGTCWALADAPEMAELEQKPYTEIIRTLAGMVADMLVEDDVPRWWALFDSKTEIIDAATVNEIATGLTEHFAARPTSPSTDSSAGRQSSGGSSNEAPSPMASVPSET